MSEKTKRKYNLSDINGINVNARRKIKLRILAANAQRPVYGVTIPRHIALNFLSVTSFMVYASGTGIVLEPVK